MSCSASRPVRSRTRSVACSFTSTRICFARSVRAASSETRWQTSRPFWRSPCPCPVRTSSPPGSVAFESGLSLGDVAWDLLRRRHKRAARVRNLVFHALERFFCVPLNCCPVWLEVFSEREVIREEGRHRDSPGNHALPKPTSHRHFVPPLDAFEFGFAGDCSCWTCGAKLRGDRG